MSLSVTVIIDTREQTPWEFADMPSQAGTLDTGDYSIRGLEHLIAVERKSLPDLLGCIGTHRDRFKREMQRMQAYRFRSLVIEASYDDLERGGWRSKIHPAAVQGSLAAWQARYCLPIMLVGNHEAGARYCARYLLQAARCVAYESAALGVTREVA